jgi:hypothetical protein
MRVGATILIAFALFLGSPAGAAGAQPRGDGFLFQPPVGSLTILGGFARPSAESDVFADARNLLTLDADAFNSFSAGVEYAFQLTPRFDIFAGLGYSGSSKRSEFRDWVDQDELPIEQNTRFTRMPIIGGARMYVLPRGHSIGQHVWFPAFVAPYLSAGAGVVWYSFKQTGDFVDFQDNEIISDNLESAGFAPMLHAGGGVEFAVGPRVILVADARYSFARAAMSDDFAGYDNIDLSGLAATAGLRIRF